MRRLFAFKHLYIDRLNQASIQDKNKYEFLTRKPLPREMIRKGSQWTRANVLGIMRQITSTAVFKMESQELKFDRLPETLAQVGLRKSQLYVLVARGEFPQPVRLAGRAVAWERSEIQAWMRTRLEASRRPSGK